MAFLEETGAKGGETYGTAKEEYAGYRPRRTGQGDIEPRQGEERRTYLLFMTAFECYQIHIRHLQDLQTAIETEGTMVEKEYVKGRPNLYVNPAISAYNQTANSADKTLSALLKLLAVLDVNGQDDADEFANVKTFGHFK